MEITINNLDKLKKLLQLATKQAEQLQETLGNINQISLEPKIQVDKKEAAQSLNSFRQGVKSVSKQL